MGRYRSRAGARVPVVWERLTVPERRILCTLGDLIPGAAHVPFERLSADQARQVVNAMRAAASLGQECLFALAYTREPRQKSKQRTAPTPGAR